jgi:hypothetical protein
MTEPLSDDVTLGEVREYVLSHADEGVECPACTQFVKIYRWSPYGSAVVQLIRLYQAGGTTEFVESKTVKRPGEGGEATRLRHWGLVERDDAVREDGGKSGFWRVTPLGEQFILRQATIPKYVYTFNNQVLERGGPEVDIVECLGKKFDYNEMMEPAA